MFALGYFPENTHISFLCPYWLALNIRNKTRKPSRSAPIRLKSILSTSSQTSQTRAGDITKSYRKSKRPRIYKDECALFCFSSVTSETRLVIVRLQLAPAWVILLLWVHPYNRLYPQYMMHNDFCIGAKTVKAFKRGVRGVICTWEVLNLIFVSAFLTISLTAMTSRAA